MIQSQLPPGVLQTLSEVMTWCSHFPFRSPALDPSSILDVPDWSHDSEPFEPWAQGKYDSFRRAISWINDARSKLLKEAGIEILNPVDTLAKCRLLLYWPLETVEDGASEAGSMGFYDMQDSPPWDTWFFYADRAIFCCVPEFAFSRAQDGIDGNPVACIEWAEWSRLARVEN